MAEISRESIVEAAKRAALKTGFLVEAVRTSYPDCEAKRCVDRNRDRWQRVLVEFEYRSSNFQEHGHDPSKCDLIVCWEMIGLIVPLKLLNCAL